MKDKLFFISIFGFLSGVLLSSYLKINFAFVLFGVVLVGSFFLLYFFSVKKEKIFIFCAFTIIFITIGMLRFYVYDLKNSDSRLDNFLSKNITLSGVILDEVSKRENDQRFVLNADKVSYLGHDYKTKSKILVSADKYPYFSYGDAVKVTGKLSQPENFINDFGKEFDYENYLKKDGIYYTMSFGKTELLSENNGNFIKRNLFKIKSAFLSHINSILFPPESSLLSGLILGVKSAFGESLQNAFVNTGLVHIVVLSGYNVTIIAESLIKAISFASVALSIYFGAFVIILFAIMTGAGSTIIRASIMAILALFARATGRNYDIIRALLLAAALMVLWNPKILAFDISFELSFLATLGLIFMSPVFKEKMMFLPEKWGIREIAASTIGVQIFVLPFILYKMGNLSIVAPVTNILVLPFIPLTMFFGFFAAAFSFLSKILAAPFTLLAHILLKFEIFVIETFSRLPFSSLHVKNFPFIFVIIFYIFVFYKLFKFYQKRNLPL